ncbi:MAG: 6-phosphofructokinase, partial [Bacteroidales bacterium]|nr:6-phosphofructokinase [Bacteroidales bacterium]
GIIIVSEGGKMGSAEEVAAQVKEHIPEYSTRVTTLGHIQRGGSPTCSDRVLASTLGYEAVGALLDNRKGVMVGIRKGDVTYTPFEEACSRHNQINRNLYEITKILSV